MFRPLPSSLTVRWRPAEGDGLEHLTITSSGAGFRAGSVLIGERGGQPYGMHYRIDCNAQWEVTSFLVENTHGQRLVLRSPKLGHWLDDAGQRVEDLTGCVDIDLSGTPFTNTLPIRRLSLNMDSGPVAFKMLYVPFESLQPVPDHQIYTCLTNGKLYRYAAADRTFTADLPVDDFGLVTDYPTLFKRH